MGGHRVGLSPCYATRRLQLHCMHREHTELHRYFVLLTVRAVSSNLSPRTPVSSLRLTRSRGSRPIRLAARKVCLPRFFLFL